jgi:hypothetical protein
MDDRKAFLLRINQELYKDVEAWAQEDLRSVNGQIEFLLRRLVQQRKRERDDHRKK